MIQEPQHLIHKSALLVILCCGLNNKESHRLSGCLLSPNFLSYKPWSRSRFPPSLLFSCAHLQSLSKPISCISRASHFCHLCRLLSGPDRSTSWFLRKEFRWGRFACWFRKRQSQVSNILETSHLYIIYSFSQQGSRDDEAKKPRRNWILLLRSCKRSGGGSLIKHQRSRLEKNCRPGLLKNLTRCGKHLRRLKDSESMNVTPS